MHAHPHVHNNTPHYIDGQWEAGSGEAFASCNPCDNTPVWSGNMATDHETSLAVSAAHRALPSWSKLSFDQRVAYVQRFAQIVDKKRQELCHLIALEAGKPLWEAMTEVTAVINKVQLSIQAYQERTHDKQTTTPTATTAVRYKPYGIIAVLGPFNFPAHLSNGHIVPALLAGNTIVYKPSELVPKVAEFIMQCWHDSGLPNGVINCIQGGALVAQALLKKDIQAVCFTGSYQTGLHIHRALSERPNVLLALEMGGNNPLIIDTVEDIDTAVYQSILSAFITAGQRCTCARRMMIPDNNQGDQFLKRFIEVTKTLRVGPFTLTPEPFMGSVIRNTHALNHLKAQQELLTQGGDALFSMQLLQEHSGLLSPGIIDMNGVSNPIDEEIFAPIVQIYRYKHFSDALTLANQTRYGLIAGLMSNNQAHYQQFYDAMHTGIIHWNKPTTGALSSLPFGGTGLSGNHRPSGFFAADYCAYPIAVQEEQHLNMPSQRLPGITL